MQSQATTDQLWIVAEGRECNKQVEECVRGGGQEEKGKFVCGGRSSRQRWEEGTEGGRG